MALPKMSPKQQLGRPPSAAALPGAAPRRRGPGARLRGAAALAAALASAWLPGRRPGAAALLPGAAAAARCAAAYSQLLAAHPLPVKCLTAGMIYAGADVSAQRIAGAAALDKRRTAASAMVGLFIFGPSSHLWFAWIFRLLPGNGLLSILAKTCLGQVFFGPYVTIVFFAAALWSTRSLSWASLRAKVKADLWPTILAGLGFWPVMDLIAFCLLSEHFIPPFLNVCAFIWTIFLSFQAARGSRAKAGAPAAAGGAA